jgi:hypothetical protein
LYNYIDFSQFGADEILVYLRKSRSDDPLLSVEEVLSKHESILDEWCERNLGRKIPEENKFREVVSGETIADRPKIQEILKRIESPKIKAVLVVEVQRLSRGDLEDAGRIIKLFRFTNTLVVTPQKTYDIRDEYDRDYFERELKRGNEFLEYTKKIMHRGILLSVSQGNFIGSIPPYGYTKTWVMDGKRKCPTLAINDEEANVVRMIFDMYVGEDMGMTNIANRLNEMSVTPPRGKHWERTTIKDMLINVHYIGKVKWNWRKTVTVVEDGEIIKTRPKSQIGEYLVYDGKHPAIISEEIFNAAQNKANKNHRAKGTTKVKNPLAGLLYCQCGKAITLRPYPGDNKPRLVCTGQTHCHTGSCTLEELISLVVDILQNSIADFEIQLRDNSEDARKMQESVLKNLERKMRDLEAKELAQWEAQANPDPAQRMPPHIFALLNSKLLKEKEELAAAIRTTVDSMPDPSEYEQKIHRFRDALEALLNPEMEAEQKNKLLKACINRIEYSREAPTRIKNPEKKTRKNTRIKGAYVKQNVLTVGGHWTNPPIELNVKLNV